MLCTKAGNGHQSCCKGKSQCINSIQEDSPRWICSNLISRSGRKRPEEEFSVLLVRRAQQTLGQKKRAPTGKHAGSFAGLRRGTPRRAWVYELRPGGGRVAWRSCPRAGPYLVERPKAEQNHLIYLSGSLERGPFKRLAASGTPG